MLSFNNYGNFTIFLSRLHGSPYINPAISIQMPAQRLPAKIYMNVCAA